MLWKIGKKMAVQNCPAAENFEKLVRRVTFLLVGTGLLITIIMAAVAGYTFYRINRAVTEVSEPLAPLVRGITEPFQEAEKSVELKNKLLSEKALGEAHSALKRGRSEVSGNIKKYSKKLSEWWGSQKKHLDKGGMLERLDPN